MKYLETILNEHNPGDTITSDYLRSRFGEQGALHARQEMQRHMEQQQLREQNPEHPQLPENRLKKYVADHKKKQAQWKGSFAKSVRGEWKSKYE